VTGKIMLCLELTVQPAATLEKFDMQTCVPRARR